MSEVRDILNAAADLIEPDGAWTQGYWARDMFGSEVVSSAEGATCWCAMGAMMRATRIVGADDATPAICAMADVVGAQIGQWNDVPGRTQAEVVAALRKAAEEA